MRLGLIAGNGRFPFLVLDAARGAGHDVTIIALKEETFPDLADIAARPPAAAMHWISLGQLGKCISLLKDAGIPDAVTMAIAGHESVAMSQRYTHVGTDAMRKATESLPEI